MLIKNLQILRMIENRKKFYLHLEIKKTPSKI
jgi:hypothetical protein